jgi:transcriptional regulator with XRE-family HTH domain
MKDQLIKIMETEGITPAKFADEIGVQRSSISHILSGRNKPSYDFIIKILERYQGINVEWLMTGKGTMIKSSIPTSPASIKQASLFDQPFKTENRVKIKQEKTLFEKSGSNNQYTRLVEDKTDEKFANSVINKELNSKFTNVNTIKQIVIFFENGTFKQYLPE